MQTISDWDAQKKFADLLSEISSSHQPVTITQNGSPRAVLLSAEDYSAMEETLYLLSTPANANRIREGLADFETGKMRPGPLCD